MTKVVLITNTHFETRNGEAIPVFQGGKHYPLTDATQRQVDLGNGSLVDAPPDAEKAQDTADALRAKADSAEQKAAEAQAAADAAAALAQAEEAAAAEAAAQASSAAAAA